MDEEEASWCVISIARCLRDKHWGAPGCGGDVRLCHSQTCGVCVCGGWVGSVRERERQEGDRRAAVEQQHGTKERESRKLSWGSSG